MSLVLRIVFFLNSLRSIWIKLHTCILKFFGHFTLWLLLGFTGMNKLLWIIICTANVSWTFIAFLDQLLKKQIIRCSYLIMFIGLNAFASIAFFEGEVFVHFVENTLIYWYWINTKVYSFEVTLTRYNIEPRMLPNLFNGQSFLWICVENSSQQIVGFIRNVIWCCEIRA